MMAASACRINSPRNACSVTVHSSLIEDAVVRPVGCKGTLGRNYYPSQSSSHALALKTIKPSTLRRMELVFRQSKGQTHALDLAEDPRNWNGLKEIMKAFKTTFTPILHGHSISVSRSLSLLLHYCPSFIEIHSLHIPLGGSLPALTSYI